MMLNNSRGSGWPSIWVAVGEDWPGSDKSAQERREQHEEGDWHRYQRLSGWEAYSK